MQYLFVFYIESQNGFLYKSPEPWFNEPFILASCPSAVFHTSETHLLHEYGDLLKNLGLRSSMIIETNDSDEALILRMIIDQVINVVPNARNKPPILQMILKDPEWDALAEVSAPLWSYRASGQKRLDDHLSSMLMQKQVDRLVDMVNDTSSSLSDRFLRDTQQYIESITDEIERIQKESRDLAKTISRARKALHKKLISYAIYLNEDCARMK